MKATLAIGLLAVCLIAPWPALAQAVNTNDLSASAKERKEVNIEADQMEVLQDQKKAIFTGNVDATRGDVRLKGNKLVVTYSEVDQSDGTKKTDVTFLDATGNVVIVTRRQTITGQSAHMDVKANKLTVDGNVTVTEGKTVLNGKQLNVDLDSNISQLTGGRVKGSFVPQ